jgi:hypothetical protein
MKKILCLLVFSISFTTITLAQKSPIKFGDVSIEDLQMTTYGEDSTAPAVILFDYGYFNGLTLQFTRTLRIKVLKEEGYKWANNSYPTNTKSMIKGITSNLENGKIVQEKLKNESIYATRVTEDNYRMRVAMPNVKVGSVVDLQFTFEGIPGFWNFQETIPVRYSELVIEEAKNYRFKSNYFGFEPLSLTTPTRWIARNMKSFKVEPFLSSENNFMTRLEFDILDVGSGLGYIPVTTSWDAVFKGLLYLDNFGKALVSSAYLEPVAKKIESSATTKLEKLALAHEAIKSVVKWDENESVLASNPSLGYLYRMKIGNSADINLMLVQLLKRLDIDVVPVVLSTRENGILSMASPSIEKLNYVIAQATIDGKTYLVDATETYLPYYLLPFRCLNYKGRTAKETGSEWVDLATNRKDKKLIMYDLKMVENNTLEGTITLVSTDYAAFDLRKKYNKFNSLDEYLDDFRKDKPGLLIKESKVDKIDSIYIPVNELYEVSINNKLSTIGNEVYILPMLFDQITENPFKMDSRKYPIDYGYAYEKTVISTFTIPENYSISALPAPCSLKLSGNAATFVFEVSNVGQIIKMTSRFLINKTIILPDEYFNLKEFYNQVIKKQSEPVILKKN